MTLTLLPSAEQLTVAWLKSVPELVSITGGRMGTRLPGDPPNGLVLPAVRVSRIGGVPEDEWADIPSMQLEAWAADQSTADTLIRTIRAALPVSRGVYTAGHVWTYEITSGPFWSPDDATTNARYIMTVSLLITR